MKSVANYVKQICGPSKVPGGNRPQEVFLFGSWAFFALIGLFIPENILRDHVWARDFTDAVASIVPQIDRITALNLKSDINRFHYSILWVVSPIYFVVGMISGNANVALGFNRITHGQIISVLLFSIYGIGLGMYLWWGLGCFDHDDGVTRVWFDYKVTRAIIAPLVVYGVCAFAGAIVLTIKGVITGDIFEQKRG